MKRIFALATTLLLIGLPLLAAQAGGAAEGAGTDSLPPGGGGSAWVLAVNLIIWTGIFLYLLFLHGKIRDLEKTR